MSIVQITSREQVLFAAIEKLEATNKELLEALQWAKSQGFVSYSLRVVGTNDYFCDQVDKLDAAIAHTTKGKV